MNKNVVSESLFPGTFLGWTLIITPLNIIIVSLRGKCLHFHVTEVPKQRPAEIYNWENIFNDSITQTLITSFLTYLDNTINNSPPHSQSSTLSYTDYLKEMQLLVCVLVKKNKWELKVWGGLITQFTQLKV